MPKIMFMGAGSTIFAKNVLGDCMLTPGIQNLEIALFDIDPKRLEDSRIMLDKIKEMTDRKDIAIYSHRNRKEALKDSGFVVNAIQVGGYDPCTITDFEIPKKYGLRQTIADTLGIGGIFRALRTIPVLQEFAYNIEEICPAALFLNYSNPMAMLSGYMQKYTLVLPFALLLIMSLFNDCKSFILNESFHDVYHHYVIPVLIVNPKLSPDLLHKFISAQRKSCINTV